MKRANAIDKTKYLKIKKEKYLKNKKMKKCKKQIITEKELRNKEGEKKTIGKT
jgi:hypothetical protein